MAATLKCSRFVRGRAGATAQESGAQGGARHSRTGGHLFFESERMKFEFIAEKVGEFPVRAMYRVLEVTASGLDASMTRPKSARSGADERLGLEIEAVHESSRVACGGPRVAAELRFQGYELSTQARRRVDAPARTPGPSAFWRFRTTTDSRNALNLAPELLERGFAAKAPNEV